MKGEKMSRIIYKGKLDGVFYGFDNEELFKMNNGTYWIQAVYKYWYHYEERPVGIIKEEYARYYLSVAGQEVEIRKLNSPIESRIKGEFKGWDGKTSYTLTNGQKWEQVESNCKYASYGYSPEAIVYEAPSGIYMKVAGTRVKVKRIKY